MSSSNDNRNIRLLVAYDGADFAGWQRQRPPQRTVQGELEEALAQITGAPVTLYGAGRTDAGVHATGQVAHFQTTSAIDLRGIRRGSNALTGYDLSVVDAELADPDFHARFSARGKRYVYRIFNRSAPCPLQRRTSWHLHKQLDLQAMGNLASQLVGHRSFAAFQAADCGRDNPVRHLRRLTVAQSETEKHLVTITAEGDAFLKNMVRILAGTLVDVGLGRLSIDAVLQATERGQRTKTGRTAPAHGLTLEEVFYENNAPWDQPSL